MPQHAMSDATDNPYVGIVYDRLGEPIPPNPEARMQRYLALLTSLQSRLSTGGSQGADSRLNLALMAEAIALVEQQVVAAAALAAAEPPPRPRPANEDRPPVRRRATLSFGGYLMTAITAALVSIASYFTLERWLPTAPAAPPPSITLIDTLAREVANRGKYDAYFGLMGRLEAAIGSFKAERGAYPTTRDKAFLAVSSVDLFNAEAPDPTDNDLWKFWESLTYSSNGTDFKLISVGLGTCAAVRILRPELLDPKRSQHPFDCLAFGIWTSGGRDF